MPSPCSFTDLIRLPLMDILFLISDGSTRHPRKCILAVILLSFGLLVGGSLSNFRLEIDNDVLWTPQASKSRQHQDWIRNDSGFPPSPRSLRVVVHREGANLMEAPLETIDRVVQAVQTVQDVPLYASLCHACPIHGIIDFFADPWRHSVKNDTQAVEILSQRTFPDGRRVSEHSYGSPIRDEDDILTQALTTMVQIDFPRDNAVLDLEAQALGALERLNDEWKANSSFRLERFAQRSADDEFERGILRDIPLMPLVFVLMAVFTAGIFYQQRGSRMLLGLGAVLAVFLSIVSGYGLLFCIGVPLTSMTQILPFCIFGIGLDDAFIIFGSYQRRGSIVNPVDRIHATLEDVGLSITLTTCTSVVAFGLGALSSIPAIRWLCMYAFPTIGFVWLYQITFFVALIVLDEQRLQQSRRDGCTCLQAPMRSEEEQDEEIKEPFVDRFMASLAERLLQPGIQVLVLVSFVILGGFAAYSTTLLRQEFKFIDVLPADSYVVDYFQVLEEYTGRSSQSSYVYFRKVNQSDPSIQTQMMEYTEDLVTIKGIEQSPEFFWLADFQAFVANETNTTDFVTQMNEFLATPSYAELYSRDIVRNSDGIVIQSRTRINMDNLDLDVVREQIEALEEQRSVSERQPINQGQDDWPFFTFDQTYNIWEFCKYY